jgi:hypothetical protein
MRTKAAGEVCMDLSCIVQAGHWTLVASLEKASERWMSMSSGEQGTS